jgi:hypothetical protein
MEEIYNNVIQLIQSINECMNGETIIRNKPNKTSTDWDILLLTLGWSESVSRTEKGVNSGILLHLMQVD